MRYLTVFLMGCAINAQDDVQNYSDNNYQQEESWSYSEKYEPNMCAYEKVDLNGTILKIPGLCKTFNQEIDRADPPPDSIKSNINNVINNY